MNLKEIYIYCRSSGLDLANIVYLQELENGRNCIQLSRSLGVSIQTIHYVVKRLVSKGLVVCVRPAKYGLPGVYKITDKGLFVLRSVVGEK